MTVSKLHTGSALIAAPVPPTMALAAVVCDAAIQPIVEAQSGAILGYESLLRGFGNLGCAGPVELLDHMVLAGTLHEFESWLHGRAIGQVKSTGNERALAFLNVDGRLLEQPDRVVDHLARLLSVWNWPAERVCVELCERSDHVRSPGFRHFVERAKRLGLRLALDDFGTGHAEMSMLLAHPEIDFIKIDRTFIAGVDTSPRRQAILSHAVAMAHGLSIRVIAEGVETEAEYLTCCEAGCDLLQGFLIARPTTAPAELPQNYPALADIRSRRRRALKTDEHLVRAELAQVAHVDTTSKLDQVIARFTADPSLRYLPVVDQTGYPVGIVHEQDIRKFVYADFGLDLIRNRGIRTGLANFLRRAPTADIRQPAEALVATFSTAGGAEALLVTDRQVFCGVLTPVSLVKIVNEKNLRLAHDLNPLTGLPGNAAIQDFLADHRSRAGEVRILCHFDFNDFKPFNDIYGFAAGDQAILLFARILRREAFGADRFIGHIGGDDFFAGFAGVGEADVALCVEAILGAFAEGVRALYDPADMAAGHLAARDRQGRRRRYPLMRCSAGLVRLDATWLTHDGQELNALLARAKTEAKRSATGIAWVVARSSGRATP